MNIKRLCARTSVAGWVIAALLATPENVSAAQTTETDDTASASIADAGKPEYVEIAAGIDDIVVTARRRSESLQSIPASVSAVSGDTLEQLGTRQLSDLQKQVPGLSFSSFGGSQPLISMRGDFNRIGSTEPGVGFFVDGVFLTRFTLLNQNPLDVQRIEVLKGPQSTLYGKNTVAGAVSIITADPTFNWEGYADVGYGRSSQDEDLYHLTGVISGPLVDDRLAIRLAGTIAHRDGYIRDRTDGIRGLGYHDEYLRGKLLFTPSDNLTIKLGASYNNRNAPRMDHMLTFPGAIVQFSVPGANLPGVYGPSVWHSGASFQPETRTKSWQVTAHVDLDTPIGTISSITAYQNSRLLMRNDPDDTQFDVVSLQVLDKDVAISQELRLAGSASRATWLAGLYYLNDRDSGFKQIVNFGPFSTQNALQGIASQYSGLANFSKTLGVFGQIGYDITDSLNILGGLRYSSDERRFPFDFRITTVGGVVLPNRIDNLDRRKTFSALTGNAVVTYNFSPSARIYASYSTGNKAGGFSPVGNVAAALIPYDEQLTKSYEAGIKSDLFDRRLRLNVAGFLTKISNLQVQRFSLVNNSQFFLITQNAASAEIPGVDAEIIAQLTDNLRLNAGYTYQHARIKRYQFSDTALLRNVPIPRSPAHSGNIGINYEKAVGAGKIELGGNMSFRTKFTNDILYTASENLLQTLPLDGYKLVGLNAAYSWDRFQIRAYVNNLFNKQHLVGGVLTARNFVAPTVPGEPRTFEVSFKMSL